MEPVFPSNIMIELLLPPTLPRDGKWVSQIVGDQQNFRESESEGIIDKRNCDRIVGKNFNIGGKNDRSDIKIGEKNTAFYETMSASSNYN